MDKKALSDITPRKYAPYQKAEIEGAPCPTCGTRRMYVSKRNARLAAHKDCKSCANSKKLGGHGMAFNSEGQKLCNDCRERPQKHNSLCQECCSKRLQQNYLQKYRFAKYGVTKEWFEKRFIGCCEICGSGITERTAHIDHDHDTQQVRGILCGLCNKGLGQFKDSINLLTLAAKYLEKHQ